MIDGYLKRRSQRSFQFCFSLCLFLVTQSLARADSAKPILLSETDSTRAIALESLTLTPEPFSPSASSFLYGLNHRTRITVFVRNCAIGSPQDLTSVTAEAEDASHTHYPLELVDLRPVSGQSWMSQATVELNEGLGDVGDVLISITYFGIKSNRVRIGIGHVGGGPADDAGALPTPAPPYFINGRITADSVGLAGIPVSLSGPQIATTITDSNGAYLFSVTSSGNYTIHPSSQFHVVTPSSTDFNELSGNRTANFQATLKTFTVAGQVKDEANSPLSGSIVVMSSSNGLYAAATICAADGRFDFTDVPASYDYTIYPYNTPTHAFTPGAIVRLDSDETRSFSGVRRFYTVGGVVKDRSNQGVEGVIVTLSGPSISSVITDSNGLYSFGPFAAGDNYTIQVAKTDYIFEPASRLFTLLEDESADFTATRTYRISGRVTEADGKSLAGMTINLSGAETSKVVTFNDGSYALTVTTVGDYVLTPSSSQNFYTFTPATKSLIGLSSHQTVNFYGAFSAVAHPSYVLEFDGNPMTVDYGNFWPVQVGLGHFFWEFWAMPGENNHARYLVSDGYGGAHALLFGFYNSSEPGRYTLFGNMWDGGTWTFFYSDDGPMQGEWGHYAVGWDGKNIISYYDGVPVGKQRFPGPRISMGRDWGASMPLIGGSDHQNLNGRIAQFRAYEENNPRETSPESAFAPETVFSPGGQLMSYFFRPSQTVEDLSSGYNTGEHPGILRGFDQGYITNCPACPTPKFVVDPSAPDFSNPTNPGQISSPFSTAPPTPAAALIFDSFSRSNSTYLLGGKGGLAVTESGSAGPQTWQTNVSSDAQPFGVLDGRAVVLANDSALTWVSPAINNLDIRVDRRLSVNANGVNTGLCFRVVDKENFFFTYTSDDDEKASASKKLSIGFFQNGARFTLADGILIPSNSWKTLRVVTRESGSIEVYADADLVFSTSNSTLAATSGAGLYNNGPGLGLTNRWDNFTVLSAP